MVLVMITKSIYDDKKRKTEDIKIEDDGLMEPPTPRKLPIIGHLHLLGGYEVPYQAFSAIGQKFGDIVNLKLGEVKCVVVNGQKNIREGLVTKGNHFDSRPAFERYQQLFDGNKENSLAFCDWSDIQKARRDMLKTHTFPRSFTNTFFSLEKLIATETENMISQIIPDTTTDLKQIILKNCANIFLSYFCSKKFDIEDKKFVQLVENFDEIFYEVNQGYAADFLPFLNPLLRKNLNRMKIITHEIRSFVEREIIEKRYEEFDTSSDATDYVESLIKYVKTDGADFDWETALFALEDIIGGHSAVGNFLMKVFGFLVNEPEVQMKIQQEIDQNIGRDRNVTIGDRNCMPYTEAVIFEAIRLIASPIVPRVANKDSSINGYRIEKGSVLFLNNYELNMSEELWESPKKFMPERFLRNGSIFKPEYFLPFGGGRRSCLGYRMVQLISFGVVGSFLQHFTIKAVENEIYKVPIGSLALKKDTFKFKFVSR
ncbi:cytochrome P450 307a1-like [Diorhabda sublineata]|uniref:cytochrome P450 307a1-like n=1 Tax=Diorhabda sublineata TaxID=1163346 RepID=UPI0024E108C2|nr:cytochrome P450 307a1-like [Diorhabda sublineata]